MYVYVITSMTAAAAVARAHEATALLRFTVFKPEHWLLLVPLALLLLYDQD